MKKTMISIGILILIFLFLGIISKNTGSKESEKEIIHKTAYDEIGLTVSNFFDSSSYILSSDFNDFGEELSFIAANTESKEYLFSGEYASGIEFSRVYALTTNSLVMRYETDEGEGSVDTFEELSQIPAEEKKEVVLLQSPIKVGYSWGEGEIIAIYRLSNNPNYFIEVKYQNGNKYIFEQNKGIIRIDYTLPKELIEIYGSSMSVIKATREGN